MKGYILIPVYNNAQALPELIKKLSGQKNVIPVFINDGSTDKSGDILKASTCRVLHHEKNCGKGAALRTGLSAVYPENPDFIMTMDGDGQHPVESIPDFIKLHEVYSHDIIIGSRERQSRTMPAARRLSNGMTSSLLSLRAGQRLLDSQCGFRLIPSPYYKSCCSRRKHFMFESECLIAWADQGARFRHVGIPTIYTRSGGSSMEPLKTVLDFIALYMGSLFKNYKKWNSHASQ